MKTIGLIGGLTWHSTLEYYKMLNIMTNDQLGGDEASKVIIYSVNFGEIKYLTKKGEWDEIAIILGKAATNLEKAGADCIMIGANTMHKVFDKIKSGTNIPMINVAEAVADKISKRGLNKVGLLGTKYTMQMPFYKDILQKKGIEVIIPGPEEAESLNDLIYFELARGIFNNSARLKFITSIEGLVEEGAQGIILGCTEIPLLIKEEDCKISLFDTTKIHCEAAICFALK